MSDTKPKPCPFCESENLFIHTRCVECEDCVAQGPWVEPGECPIEAWNKAPRVPAGLVGELVEDNRAKPSEPLRRWAVCPEGADPTLPGDMFRDEVRAIEQAVEWTESEGRQYLIVELEIKVVG